MGGLYCFQQIAGYIVTYHNTTDLSQVIDKLH